VKLLLDENLSHRLAAKLAGQFPGTVHVDEVGLRGQPDSSIWNHAMQQDFVIVSKDGDFRQLSLHRGSPPKVILLAVGNAGTNRIADLLMQSHSRISGFSEHPEDSLLILGTAV
jgi:predicted nuclease of predicted toxin-antitoxin system